MYIYIYIYIYNVCIALFRITKLTKIHTYLILKYTRVFSTLTSNNLHTS